MAREYTQRLSQEEKRARLLDAIARNYKDGCAEIYREELMDEASLTRSQFEKTLPRMKEEGLGEAEERFSEEYGQSVATRYVITKDGWRFLAENG